MAIISFWNESEKENGQTSSIIAIATRMAVEHNNKILVVDASFKDKTIEKAFWKNKENKALKELMGGKIDVSSGAEGLVSAVASNKATPEIITNYTKVVFTNNRLDILLGLKTEIAESHEKSLMLYKDLLLAANKFYDIIFVDVNKGNSRPSTKSILENSHLIVYTMPPNLVNIDNYKELKLKNTIVSKNNVIPLLAKSDENSAYNVRNTTRYIKERGTIATVPYNVRFMEATNEAKTADFFTKTKLSGSSNSVNGNFFDEIDRTCSIIMDKLRKLNV